MGNKITTYNPNPPFNLFEGYGMSLAAEAGNFLFITGQVGANDDGTYPEGADAQIENTYKHLDRILAGAGAKWGNVVHFRSYHMGSVEDMENQVEKMGEMNNARMRQQYTWTGLGVSALIPRGTHVEIDMVVYTGCEGECEVDRR